jgi:hypothetical protein
MTSRLGNRIQATTTVRLVPMAASSRFIRRIGRVFVSGEKLRSTSSAACSLPGSSAPGWAGRSCPAASITASRLPCSLAVTRHRPAARSSRTDRRKPAPSVVTSHRAVVQVSSVYSSYRAVNGTGVAVSMVPFARSPARSVYSVCSAPAVSVRRQKSVFPNSATQPP